MFYFPPILAEQVIAGYLGANYSGSYKIYPGLSKEFLVAPAVIVSADGSYEELEPFTRVYKGALNVSVYTQADDTSDAVTAHDQTSATIFGLMTNKDAVTGFFNGPSGAGHIWGYYEQGLSKGVGSFGEKEGRLFKSELKYMVEVQTLAVSGSGE